MLLPLMLTGPWRWTRRTRRPGERYSGWTCSPPRWPTFFYFRILAAADAANLLLVTFLIPSAALLLAAVLLGETLLPRHFLGMALIGMGLAGIDGRLPRLLGGQREIGAAT
jgi:hypothetical protein